MKKLLSPGNCPYCDTEQGALGGWGGSPEMFEAYRKDHDAGHPTNTPTSKCCEKCEGFDSKGEESWTYCQKNFEGCCHTPTTDSKNSSEKCECGEKGPHHCGPMNTTDTGWENKNDYGSLVREMFRNTDAPTPQLREAYVEGVAKMLHYGVPRQAVFSAFFLLHNLYTSRAKEEYERGRKDAVEFIREKYSPYLGERGTLDEWDEVLEAAPNILV